MIKSSIFPTVRQVQAVCVCVCLCHSYPFLLILFVLLFYFIQQNNDTMEHEERTSRNYL